MCNHITKSSLTIGLSARWNPLWFPRSAWPVTGEFFLSFANQEREEQLSRTSTATLVDEHCQKSNSLQWSLHFGNRRRFRLPSSYYDTHLHQIRPCKCTICFVERLGLENAIQRTSFVNNVFIYLVECSKNVPIAFEMCFIHIHY